MNPLHFGSPHRPLFGAYHPPARRPIHPDAVVVCGPVGIDYQRTHRALRLLAEQMARRGHHVLRFDYFGMGDSGGQTSEGDLDGWEADARSAIDEVRAISGSSSVSLVGVRLGGALAMRAASRRPEVRAAALWDPVVRGVHYLVELGGPMTPASGTAFTLSRDLLRWASDGALHVQGYPFGPVLIEGLRAVDLTRHPGPPSRFARLGLFLSDPDPASDAFAMRMEESGVAVLQKVFRDAGAWRDPERLGGAVLAPSLLHEVAGWLS